LRNEWFWAALLFACPFVIFGVAETVAMVRRRREAAIAQRTKRPSGHADKRPARRAG